MKDLDRQRQFLRVLNDPHRQADRLLNVLARQSDSAFEGGTRQNGSFVLNIGSTRTSDITGISAAGATPLQRRLTPSIDADLLLSGAPRSGEAVPISPIGIVSPVVISHACLKLMKLTPTIVDCGTFRTPMRSHLTAGTVVANCVSTGNAMDYHHVLQLFEQGRRFAQTLNSNDCVILAECVPAGTTTALAVLKGFGVAAEKLVASSLFTYNSIRLELVESGLEKADLYAARALDDPLKVVAAVGDPMQPFVAGLTMEAAKSRPVILAGGSQMLAIFHLCDQISRVSHVSFDRRNVFVVTTKWIADDLHSNTTKLSEILDVPYFAAVPDFHSSQYSGLRAYEDGHVKEGVGAGALMLAAAAKLQLSNAELMLAIDSSYAEFTDTIAHAASASQPLPLSKSI